MRAAGMNDSDARAFRPILGRLITLELEKMARYGEARASEALIRVESIAKQRDAFSVRALLL
jgi:hypothetical protein